MAVNEARFTINGTPSQDPTTGDRLFIATSGQTLSMTLEVNPSPALSATFEVLDPTDSEAPLASKTAPLITWVENGLARITLGPVPFGINDAVTIDMPAGIVVAYLVRCTVATAGDGSPGSQEQVFERLVLIFSTNTTPPIRKTIPAETTEARARAWSDSINDIVDAIENLVVGAMTNFLVSGAGQFTVPVATSVGDVVYITGANTADRADSAAIGTMPGIGIVKDKPTAGTATIIYVGMVTGLAGMTPGAVQYVGSLGALVESGALPSAPGSVIQQVGVAESATSLIFQPQQVLVL